MNESTVEVIKEASRPVRYAAAAALTVLALFLVVKTADALDQFGVRAGQPVNTITVTGEGKSNAAPDIAMITYTVQQTATTVKAAQDAATKQTNDSIAALKAEGIADVDVKTLGYNVNPQYSSNTTSCPPGVMCPMVVTNTNTITGYQVSQTVQVKVRDTTKAGAVLQKLGTLNVQNISGPNFMVDDTTAVTDAARANAIADARTKADTLAKQLHVRLGNVVSYNENGGAYPSPMYSALSKGATMDAVAPAPSLPTGTNETDVTVSVTYEIK
ncbi:MAG: hypothetical protein JWM39_57 [Parcubacteria group bacterium]|nr:hypothetical protein [Parcubacteria group bacterium]